MTDNDASNTGAQYSGQTTEDCRRMVDHALTRNPVVKFMLEKLEEVGSSIDST